MGSKSKPGQVSWNDYFSWLGEDKIQQPEPKVSPPLPSRLNSDSRTIAPGDWFVPLKGANSDGHRFIGEAFRKGAAGVFYAAPHAAALNDEQRSKGVRVQDPFRALQQFAAGWRENLRAQVQVAAMTGSAGKTTTREMLAAILREAGSTNVAPASFNNELGVPLTLLKLAVDHQYCALEFGARHVGDIAFLTKLARPNVVACLNVGTAHIGEFGGFENLLKTKLEIFTESPTEAVCVANADDPRILRAAAESGRRFLCFGKSATADVQILEVHPDEPGMSVRMKVQGTDISFQLPTNHVMHPMNAAAAVTMALAMGVDSKAMIAGLAAFVGGKGRYQVHKFGAQTIIDDSYNANPESMRAGLESLRSAYPHASKVVILGDMLELGPETDSEHEKLGQFCQTTVRPEFLITVGESARATAAGALKAGMAKDRIRSFGHVDELRSELSLLKGYEVLFAKASNAINLSKLIEDLLSQHPT